MDEMNRWGLGDCWVRDLFKLRFKLVLTLSLRLKCEPWICPLSLITFVFTICLLERSSIMEQHSANRWARVLHCGKSLEYF